MNEDTIKLTLKKTPKSFLYGDEGYPLYKYNGSNREFCKEAEKLPFNANYITTDGMWKLEKKESQ